MRSSLSCRLSALLGICLALALLLALCLSPVYAQEDDGQEGSSAEGGGGEAEGVTDEALGVHNEYREKHGASPLEQSEELEQSAKEWATQLASDGCSMTHSNGEYGENLAVGQASIGDAVESWYNEVDSYDYNNPSFSEATGHFTQVVWAGSQSLGCAQAACDEGKSIYVCQYDPKGNMSGEFEDNVLPEGGSQGASETEGSGSEE